MRIMAIVKLEHKLKSPYSLVTVVRFITFAQSIISGPVRRQSSNNTEASVSVGQNRTHALACSSSAGAVD